MLHAALNIKSYASSSSIDKVLILHIALTTRTYASGYAHYGVLCTTLPKLRSIVLQRLVYYAAPTIESLILQTALAIGSYVANCSQYRVSRITLPYL